MSENFKVNKEFEEYKGYSGINSYLDQFKTVITPDTKIDSTPEIPKEVADLQYLQDKYNSKNYSLKAEDLIAIPNTDKLSFRITDGYHIRHFSGREGEHSTAMDYTVADANGKKVDGVYAVADGVIRVARQQKIYKALDENGAPLKKPKEGTPLKNDRLYWGKSKKKYKGKFLHLYTPSAGYLLEVEQSDGTFAQYMHLDAMTEEQMNDLVGKKIKRGDKIGNYLAGSGTGTGAHVKYRVYSVKGEARASHIDPSAWFLNLVGSDEKNPPKIDKDAFNIPSSISQEQLEKIKSEEGLAGSNGKPALKVYELNDGHLTVGWGHAEPKDSTALKVGQVITRKQAENYLKEDVGDMQHYLNNYFTKELKANNINFNINQQMYDALFSFMYNIGPGNFKKSEVFNHIKNGEYKAAGNKLADSFITFEGHKSRRKRESELFLEGVGLLGILPKEKEKKEKQFKKGSLDYYINQLFDFESTSGTWRGGAHSDFGYNSATVSNKQTAFDLFYKDYLPIYDNSNLNWVTNIEKIRLYDFNFNSGRDLRGYAVNEYFKEKFNSEFENRNYDKTDPTRANFTEEQHKKAEAAQKQDAINKFNQYIKPLSLKERLRLFDNGRQWFYAYVIANNAKDAYFNSWKKRLELYGGFKGDDIDKLDSFRK